MRASKRRVLALFVLVALAIVGAFAVAGMMYLTNMPGKSPSGSLPSLMAAEAESRDRLSSHVHVLAGEIGGRSAGRYANLEKSVAYIESQLAALGYEPARQTFEVAGQAFSNIAAELAGTEKRNEAIVIGAHYDTAGGLPGANDNGSGVAAVLELARVHAKQRFRRTVRWLFFVNEEPPYFQSDAMGSYRYAKACRERNDDIKAMLSLETIGYYNDEPGSQQYPIKFHPGLPDRADFLGFVSNVGSAKLLRRVMKQFRSSTRLPSEGAAAPVAIPGVGWSDHWSFWQFGYPAVMVTDTALYRYPHYHTAQDTPDKLDYDRLARALTGLAAVVQDLADR